LTNVFKPRVSRPVVAISYDSIDRQQPVQQPPIAISAVSDTLKDIPSKISIEVEVSDDTNSSAKQLTVVQNGGKSIEAPKESFSKTIIENEHRPDVATAIVSLLDDVKHEEPTTVQSFISLEREPIVLDVIERHIENYENVTEFDTVSEGTDIDLSEENVPHSASTTESNPGEGFTLKSLIDQSIVETNSIEKSSDKSIKIDLTTSQNVESFTEPTQIPGTTETNRLNVEETSPVIPSNNVDASTTVGKSLESTFPGVVIAGTENAIAHPIENISEFLEKNNVTETPVPELVTLNTPSTTESIQPIQSGKTLESTFQLIESVPEQSTSENIESSSIRNESTKSLENSTVESEIINNVDESVSKTILDSTVTDMSDETEQTTFDLVIPVKTVDITNMLTSGIDGRVFIADTNQVTLKSEELFDFEDLLIQSQLLSLPPPVLNIEDEETVINSDANADSTLTDEVVDLVLPEIDQQEESNSVAIEDTNSISQTLVSDKAVTSSVTDINSDSRSKLSDIVDPAVSITNILAQIAVQVEMSQPSIAKTNNVESVPVSSEINTDLISETSKAKDPVATTSAINSDGNAVTISNAENFDSAKIISDTDVEINSNSKAIKSSQDLILGKSLFSANDLILKNQNGQDLNIKSPATQDIQSSNIIENVELTPLSSVTKSKQSANTQTITESPLNVNTNSQLAKSSKSSSRSSQKSPIEAPSVVILKSVAEVKGLIGRPILSPSKAGEVSTDNAQVSV